MKATESESSRFRDLGLYGDEGLRFERRPMLEGTLTESHLGKVLERPKCCVFCHSKKTLIFNQCFI